MKAIINGKIIYKNNIVENKILLFEKTIIDICDSIPENCEIIDAKGMYVSPGLIDIHIHGSNGFDVMDDDYFAVKNISKSIAQNGVTSFLPTTMTMESQQIYNALNKVKDALEYTEGAKIIGAHLEGPFINQIYKGAQNPIHIQKPDYEFIKNYIDCIKIISYAPEMDEDLCFTKEVLDKTDIVLSMAHTNCTYELGKKYAEQGVSNITHLFNAMTPLKHRDLGIVGLGFKSDMYCEIIADNIHINKELYSFIIKNKNIDKIILITDSMRAANLEDGQYDLGGQNVIVKNNAARIEDGSLAGSVLTLNKAVYNIYENTDLDIIDSVRLASLNPAKSIKIDDKKGSIEIGKDADIAIFDECMNCYLTISEGKEIYKKYKG